MTKNIGIIGLGRTGLPAARAFLKAGFDVYGFDKNKEMLPDFEKAGGKSLANSKEVAARSDVVLIMVLNDAQVLEVIRGEKGVLGGADKKTTVICMSTINRVNLESMADLCEEKGIDFIDCPFTGGPARIPDGSLTLIAAAPAQILQKVKPVLDIIGNIVNAGDRPGMGQAVKHCNQLLVGVTHAATMEVITMARKMDLDPELVTEVVGSGIAGSDYFKLLSESVLTKKPSPGGLGQMCKDVSIVANTAREVKMPALVATAASQYFLSAEALEMQDREGADLIEVVERMTGK